MKTTLLFLSVFLSATLSGQVPSYVPTDGLVGWWPFNGNANDESVNTNNGTVNGAFLTSDRFENFESAYNFDGQDDYISLPNASVWNFGESDFTISSWFKTSSTIQNGNIIRYDDCYGPESLWGLRIYGEELNFLIDGVGNPGVALYSTSEMDVPMFDNQWHCAMAIRRGSQMEVYFDGVLEANETVPSVNIETSGFSPSIGKCGTGNFEYFIGDLDDIGLWDRALTIEEIINLYDSNLNLTELTTSKNLVKILDMMGRETSFKPNTPLIYVYDDGSIEKVFSVEY